MGRLRTGRGSSLAALDWPDETNGLEMAGQTIVSRVGKQTGGFVDHAMFTIAGAPAMTNVNNLLWLRCTAQATAQGVARTVLAFPMHVPGSAFGSVVPRVARQYRWDVIASAAALGAGGAFIGIGPQINSLTGVAQAGAEWIARSTLNGGAWTPRYRRVSTDAITEGPSSGILLGASEHLLSLVYREGAIPSLTWLIDEIVLFTVSNAAGLIDALSVGLNLRPQFGTESGGAVTLFDCRDSRIRVV